MKSLQEIEDQIILAEENDGKFHGMTYEQGVKDALEWATEMTDEKPIEL